METGSFLLVSGEVDQVYLLDDGCACVPEGGSWRVLGRCMEPALLPGDGFELAPLVGPVRRGQILVYRYEGRLRVHRVVRVQGRHFWARGDANTGEAEGPVEASQIVGFVKSRRRGARVSSLDRMPSRWLGVVRNWTLRTLRLASERHPGLVRFVEQDLLGHPLARESIGMVCRFLVGGVRIREIEDPEVLIGAMVSERLLSSANGLSWVQDATRSGALRLLVLEAARSGRIGQVLLYQMTVEEVGFGGLMLEPRVRLRGRGLGFERDLAEGVESVARTAGWSFLIGVVQPNSMFDRVLRERGWKLLSEGEIEAMSLVSRLPLLTTDRVPLRLEL